jgi:hypothetical protein
MKKLGKQKKGAEKTASGGDGGETKSSSGKCVPVRPIATVKGTLQVRFALVLLFNNLFSLLLSSFPFCSRISHTSRFVNVLL